MHKVKRESAEHMHPGTLAQSRDLAVSLESQAGCFEFLDSSFLFQAPMSHTIGLLYSMAALGCCWEGGMCEIRMAARAGSAESLC